MIGKLQHSLKTGALDSWGRIGFSSGVDKKVVSKSNHRGNGDFLVQQADGEEA